VFTGIVQAIGTVSQIAPKGGDVELCVSAPTLDLSGTAVGDSIACSGCCLTVIKLDRQSFYVDVSRESLEKTTLQFWQVGTEVDLERALRAGDALGGHYVTGHVDGVGNVSALLEDARSVRVDIEVPRALGSYIARKGSICVDGVSLTVNAMPQRGVVQVSLVPYTRAHTTLGALQAGDRVHVEADVLGKYVRQLCRSPS